MQVLWDLCGLAAASLPHNHGGRVRLHQPQDLPPVLEDWQALPLILEAQALIAVVHQGCAAIVSVSVEGDAKGTLQRQHMNRRAGSTTATLAC